MTQATCVPDRALGKDSIRVARLVALMLALLAAVGGPIPTVSGQEPSAPTPDPAPSLIPSPGPNTALSPVPSLPPRARATVGAAAERPLVEREVFGFLPHWELADAAAIDLDGLTTLAWFGVEAGADGSLVRETDAGKPSPGWAGWTGEAFGLVMDRAQSAGVRVVLTVERFAWDSAGEAATRELLGDRSARARLVDEIVAAITERGADGVNLDVEPLPRAMRSGFTDLVLRLRAAMDDVDPSLQLTFDVTSDVSSYPLTRLTAADAAHAAILMGYEYHTARSRVAGAVAPLRDPDGPDIVATVRRALARAPAERLILALPWYGRAWSTRGAEPGSRTRGGDRVVAPSTAWYEDAVVRAASAGRRFDRTQASAYSAYRASPCETCRASWRQLWFDDVDAVLAKAGHAVRQDLRGVGIWALGYEGARPELWWALAYALDGRPDATPPTGSAGLSPQSVLGAHDGLPLVGDVVGLNLAARDGPDGSGVAYVRVATGGRLTDDGQLRSGTTYPAVEALTISMPKAAPVDEVFVPGGGAPAASPTPSGPLTASPTAAASNGPGAAAPSPDPALSAAPARRTLHVQWRDVAGNWSTPVELPVAWRAGAVPGGG